MYLAGVGFGRDNEEEISFDSLYWLAPECLSTGESPNPVRELASNGPMLNVARLKACDVSSFGLLIYEIWGGSTPYRALRGDATDTQGLRERFINPVRSGKVKYVHEYVQVSAALMLTSSSSLSSSSSSSSSCATPPRPTLADPLIMLMLNHLNELASECYDVAVEARPTMEQVCARLVPALLEDYFSDEVARESWARSFGFKLVRTPYGLADLSLSLSRSLTWRHRTSCCQSIPWPEFINYLCNTLRLENNPSNIEYRCVHRLLQHLAGVPGPDTTDFAVTTRVWHSVLNWFGPLRPAMLTEIHHLLRKSYVDAARGARRRGSWLTRSATAGFTV